MTLIATHISMEHGSVVVARADVPTAVGARVATTMPAFRDRAPFAAAPYAGMPSTGNPLAGNPTNATAVFAVSAACATGAGISGFGKHGIKQDATASTWSTKHHRTRRLWEVPQ